jgi:hypothetical protein
MERRNPGIAAHVTMVLAMLALATASEAQRTSTGTGKPATKPATTPAPKSVAKPAPVATPDGRRTGFVLGVYTMAAPGLSLSGADIDDGPFRTNFGPGGGVMIGYGFNRTFSGYASVDVAKQSASDPDIGGSFGLRHIELGARANLPYGSRTTVPYLTASYGRRSLGARVTDYFEGTEYDMRLSGGMFGVGGGVEHVISPTLAVDGGLSLGFGSFSHADIDGASGPFAVNGTTSVRLKIGMTWRPAPRS